jgi:hypothetical protein
LRHYSFFFSRFNRMATDKGFLAAGIDGHVLNITTRVPTSFGHHHRLFWHRWSALPFFIPVAHYTRLVFPTRYITFAVLPHVA